MEEQVKQNQQMPNQEGDLINKIGSEYFLGANIIRLDRILDMGLEDLKVKGFPLLIVKVKLNGLELLYSSYIYHKSISEGYRIS